MSGDDDDYNGDEDDVEEWGGGQGNAFIQMIIVMWRRR